jgi:PAS domain S-box-containing protein
MDAAADAVADAQTVARIAVAGEELGGAKDIVRELEQLGYSVVGSAATAAQTLALVTVARPDLVLIDTRLDGAIDGIETALRIRETGTPVIFTSACSDGDTLARAKAALPYGFLTKPVRAADLRGAIDMALARSRADGAADRAGLEERYRRLVEHTHDAIVVFGPDGAILEANHAAAVCTGYRQEELRGKTWADIVDPAIHTEHARQFGVLFRDGSSRAPRVAIRHADGSQRVLDATRTVVHVGGERLVMSISRDVTDLVDSETALRASEERFRTLVSSVEEMVHTLDRNLVCTGVYGRGAERAGIRAEDRVGRHLRDILPPRAAAEHEAAIARARANDRATLRWTLEFPDGVHEMESGYGVLHDAEGDCAGFVVVSRDVTESRRLESQIIVSDRLAAIGTMAASVTHEIGNALAPLLANLSFARSACADLRPSAPVAQLDELAEVIDEANHAVENIRVIARDVKVFVDLGHDRLVPIDVVAVLEAVLRMTKGELKYRAQVVSELEGVPRVLGVEARLAQVFLNLVLNAAQAMEGGPAKNRLLVRSKVDGTRVVVEIGDTGPGLPDTIADRLFHPFVTTKPLGVGTGLGLSICHRIVTGMGGEIGVESRKGLGCTFRIRLPSLPPEPSRARVLIVDDDEAVRRAVVRVLAGEHDVTAVAGAADALDILARGERFDLILADIVMPGMSGVDLWRRVEKLLPDQVGRFMFFTAGTFSAATRAEVAASGCACLEKPIDGPRLLRAVRDTARNAAQVGEH